MIRLRSEPPSLPSQAMPELPTPILQRRVAPYPGSLSSEQKNHLQAIFENDFQLKLAFSQAPEISVTVRRQNLFESQASVIVNAANTGLGGGGGIDGLIHLEGEDDYAQAHFALRKLYRGDQLTEAQYERGHAAMISSGKLKEKYHIDRVIVVAGPEGRDVTDEKRNQLYSCYWNSLQLAHQEGKESLAFPSISTGIFGFPKDEAAAISLRALYDFTAAHPKSPLKHISIHCLPSDPRSFLETYARAAAAKD